MDQRMRAALDRYIEGGRPQREQQTLRCPSGHAWEVTGTREYGMWSPDSENEWCCPECGQPSVE